MRKRFFFLVTRIFFLIGEILSIARKKFLCQDKRVLRQDNDYFVNISRKHLCECYKPNRSLSTVVFKRDNDMQGNTAVTATIKPL